MDPIVGGALIGGGVNLLGNLLGFGNNKSTNKTNYQIAQMNNQFNERMFQKQLDYNYDMWFRNNAYNTPEQQRKRYEQAGFNPYLALGNIQAGQAQSVGGVNPPTAQPVTMQPFQPDFSGIGQAAQSYVANRLMEKRNNAVIAVDEAKANQINIENKYKAADLAATIWQKIENTRNERQKRFYQQMLNNTFEQQFSTDMRKKDREIQEIEATVREKNLNIAIGEIHLSNLPKQYQSQFALIASEVLLKSAQEKLSKQQTSHELEKELETKARKFNIRLNNINLRKMSKAIVEKAIQETLPAVGKYGSNLGDWFNKREYGEYK